MTPSLRNVLLIGAASLTLVQAQVYSPRLLLADQPDASDRTRFAKGICARAGAKTPRARAEAIWRFFLTDGRFVAPGFWYHIGGWAFEELANNGIGVKGFWSIGGSRCRSPVRL